MPASRIAAIRSEVATGRRMNWRDGLTGRRLGYRCGMAHFPGMRVTSTFVPSCSLSKLSAATTSPVFTPVTAALSFSVVPTMMNRMATVWSGFTK